MSEIRLIPFERAHGPEVRRWLLDDDLRDRLGTVRPPSEFEHEQWMERQATDPSRVVRVIESDGELLGMCGLMDLDPTYRCAEIWLYLSGRRRSGVGAKSARQLLVYAFGTLGLHRIRARVFDFNEPAQRFFVTLGFTHEGVERDAVFKRGAFHDVHLFGLLEGESET